MSEREPIGVVGAGWVGLVTAACFAELGHRVVVREILPEKVEALARGEVPIHEPELPELIERNRERLTFTTEMATAARRPTAALRCVQTPPTYSGDADLSAVQRAVEEIGEPDGKALVMKSTVPVGTGRTIHRGAPDLAYVSCPEFLKEGTAVKDFLEPDRVVVGFDRGDEWAADAVAAAYEPLGSPIVRTDLSSAEMIKLASNAYLATKISFINEIANVCDEVGADVTEVARGMGMDPRIGDRFLNAGLGLRRKLFPQGHPGAEDPRRQQRLPLPAPQRRDRGERAAEAPGDGEALEAPGIARRQACRAARTRFQTGHRRYARGVEPGAGGASRGRGGIGGRLRPGRRAAGPQVLPSVEMAGSSMDALDGADAACWSPNGPSSQSSTGGRSRSA